MTIKTEIDEISRFVTEAKEMKSVQAKVLKDSLEGLYETFFQEVTTITSVSWRQYTDSFNDGDACQFRVHALMGISLAEDEFEGGGNWARKYAIEDGVSEADFDLFMGISNLHDTLPGDLMEEIYGDGFEIIVTKDGVTVEETDHD